MAEWTKVATLEECPPGSLRKVMVGPEPVVLANVEGAVYAVLDRCTHEDLPLSDGEMEGTDLVCCYHGARFDVTSGAPRALPAVKPVKTFPVEMREDGIYIQGA
ncbi:MAG: non-heme iron oxygenase ferredoxin subunit [Longimicrobiales bacterium]